MQPPPVFGDAGMMPPGMDAPVTTGGDAGTTPSQDTGPVSIDTAKPTPDTAPTAVACARDNDCTTLGKVCNREARKCVACTANSHCKAGQRCAANACEAIVKCDDSLACAAAPAGNKICNQVRGECDQCTSVADCPAKNDCTGGRCVPFTSCKTSLDCPLGMTCDGTRERCFACVRDADCGDGKVCAGNVCRATCQSDNQCVSSGLLCSIKDGFCAACFKDEDCADEQHCQVGSCKADVCTPGGSVCDQNGVRTCNAAGSAYLATAPCLARQTCVATGGRASCNSWICTAGQVECDNNAVVVCSADGLREVNRTACSNGQFCVSGACSDLVCMPGQKHCYLGSVYDCAGNGLSRSISVTCNNTQYCDDTAAPVCRAQVCTPNQPACDGNSTTTCNATGSGYTGNNVSCGQQTCVSGTCQDALIDTVSYPNTMSYDNARYNGNDLAVTQTRVLKAFEFHGRSATTQSVRFNVYESTGSNNWTLIRQTIVPITASATEAYHSSGNLDVTLTAGKLYSVGVQPVTSNIFQGYNLNQPVVTLSWTTLPTWSFNTSTLSTVTMSSYANGVQWTLRYTTGTP